MPRYWIVLSGRADDNIFDIVEEEGLVGIGWRAVGDLRDLDRSAIWEKVNENYPERPAGLVTAMLDDFANQMQIGDIVQTRNPNERRVLLGRITGDYEFNGGAEVLDLQSHTRCVEWLRTAIPFEEYKNVFSNNGKNPAWGRTTVANIDAHKAEIWRRCAIWVDLKPASQSLRCAAEHEHRRPPPGLTGSDDDRYHQLQSRSLIGGFVASERLKGELYADCRSK